MHTMPVRLFRSRSQDRTMGSRLNLIEQLFDTSADHAGSRFLGHGIVVAGNLDDLDTVPHDSAPSELGIEQLAPQARLGSEQDDGSIIPLAPWMFLVGLDEVSPVLEDLLRLRSGSD